MVNQLPRLVPEDYRVVFLPGPDPLPADSPLAFENLEWVLGAQMAHSWAHVLVLDTLQPLDALLIHKNALSGVNREELRELYLRSVVIVVLNTYGPELAEILDLPRIAADNFASQPYPGDFYVMVSQRTQGSHEFYGRSNNAVEVENDVGMLALDLLTHLEDLAMFEE
jgi:hypothetical protein